MTDRRKHPLSGALIVSMDLPYAATETQRRKLYTKLSDMVGGDPHRNMVNNHRAMLHRASIDIQNALSKLEKCGVMGADTPQNSAVLDAMLDLQNLRIALQRQAFAKNISDNDCTDVIASTPLHRISFR